MTDEQLKNIAVKAAAVALANDIAAYENETPDVRAAIIAVRMVREGRGDVADASICAANAARIMRREPQKW